MLCSKRKSFWLSKKEECVVWKRTTKFWYYVFQCEKIFGYSKEKLIQKIVYPLSTKGYKKVRAKLLKDQFSTNVASDLGVSKEEIHEVYSILNKIIEEENENEWEIKD